MSESYLEIQLDQQPIELCKLLKIANLVTGGGEAKVVISEGYVLLNGEVEYQKRKKIYHNDIIEFNGDTIQVVINEGLTEEVVDIATENSTTPQSFQTAAAQFPSTNQSKKKADSKNKEIKKAASTNEDTAKSSKRKPISF